MYVSGGGHVARRRVRCKVFYLGIAPTFFTPFRRYSNYKAAPTVLTSSAANSNTPLSKSLPSMFSTKILGFWTPLLIQVLLSLHTRPATCTDTCWVKSWGNMGVYSDGI